MWFSDGHFATHLVAATPLEYYVSGWKKDSTIQKGFNVKRNLVTVFVIFILSPLYSQTIGISPGDDGRLYPQIELDWKYGETPVGSRLRLQTKGSSETDRTPPATGLEQSITTVEEHYFGELIPAYYRLSRLGFALSPGIGVQADWFDIQEVGFVDLEQNGTEYRLFFNNDRKILSLRPGAQVQAEMNRDRWGFSMSGFYAPWLLIRLDQEFSSAAPGTTQFDTPVTNHLFQDSGTNGWGLEASFRWDNTYVPVSVHTSLQGFSIDYSYIGIGANELSQEIGNITGSINVQVTLGFLKIRQSHPMVGIVWNIDRTTNKKTNEVATENLPARFLIGLDL